MPTVHAPDPGFSGTSVGVEFTDGKGTTDDPSALAYFARKGYRIDDQPERPAGNASRDAWVDYAEAQGATDVDDLSRDELRERYG